MVGEAIRLVMWIIEIEPRYTEFYHYGISSVVSMIRAQHGYK